MQLWSFCDDADSHETNNGEDFDDNEDDTHNGKGDDNEDAANNGKDNDHNDNPTKDTIRLHLLTRNCILLTATIACTTTLDHHYQILLRFIHDM